MNYSRFLPDQIRSLRLSGAVSAVATFIIGLYMGRDFYDGTLLNLIFMTIYTFVVIGGCLYLILWFAFRQLDPPSVKHSSFGTKVAKGLLLLALKYLQFSIIAMICIGAFYFLLWMTGRL